MTRQRFLAKQQCVENVIVVDALDVTKARSTPIFLSNFDVILAPFRWRRMVLSMC